jgi:dolichol-phosphate mannosyltransferase
MPRISIIIPTRNESENIGRLLKELEYLKEHYDYEAVVVDDSTDNTASVAKENGARIIRGQQKGLGQAIIDGIKGSYGQICLVMDADLSHSPSAVIELLEPITRQGYDLVIGSRYVKGGDYSNWALKRRIQSVIGVKLMQLVTGVRDSNSGFFAFRKAIVDGTKLNGTTWKIMLEVLFRGSWISKLEVPIHFGERNAGNSKRSSRQVFKDAFNLIGLLVHKFPKRYISFAIVGGIGAISYFVIFWAITEYLHIWYGYSYFIATMYAILQNYTMNHFITFRKDRKHNKNHLLGIAKYMGGSWVGESVEYCIMLLLVEIFGIWYILSDFIGSGFSSVIKYLFFKDKIWGDKTNKRVANSPDYEWHSFYKGLPWQKRWKQLIARTVKQYAEEKGMAGKLLDIGCGSSPCGILINHDDYIGIDTNKAKIEFMKSKNIDNALFIHGDLNTITFIEKQYFDTVIWIEVIEHLCDMTEAEYNLMQIWQLLKENGKLIIATPNFGGFRGKAMDTLYGVFQKNAYQSEHQLKFDLPSLKALCNKMSFDHVDSTILSGADMICVFRKA